MSSEGCGKPVGIWKGYIRKWKCGEIGSTGQPLGFCDKCEGSDKSCANLLELAWGLIANAFEGNWDKAPKEWKQAAERWRDEYHEEKAQ